MNPLDTLNVTSISEITKEQFIIIANETVAIPSLIFLFVFMVLASLLIGMMLVKSEGRGKYFAIWFIWVIFSLVGLIILIYMPNLVYSIFETIKSWFTIG